MARPGTFASDYGIGGGSNAAAAAAAAARTVHAPYAYPTGDPLDPLRRGSAILAPAAPAAGGAPSAGGGPAPAGSLSIPLNYQALLEADPNYLAWQANSVANLSNAATLRKSALRALVEQYGGLPSSVKDAYGDLTKADLDAAAANPYSNQAQLKRQYDLNVEQMRRGLAARGALHSGDLGYGQAQLDTQRGQSESDLGQQFANAFQQAIGSYLGSVGQDNSDRETAIGQAYQDVMSNPAYASGGSTATLDPDWQTKYGKPVYVAGDGSLYTVDAHGAPMPYGG